jgi:VCBS repeat-containing protein
VNHAPVASAQSVTTLEDAAKAIVLSATDADGDTLTYAIVGAPAHGTLTGAAPNMTYTPIAGYNGADSFTFKANDGTADSAPAAVSIAITAVNDAPSFTKGPDQTVLEDAGAQSVANWATAISAGPADEAGQTLTFLVTANTNAALFAAGPAVDATGKLTYTPAANANGTATITLVLKDSGGTANGGVDTSAPRTFVISVTAVNDAPSFTKGANQTVNQDSGAQTVVGWATAISAGPPDESGQTLNFLVSASNTALFSVQPALSSVGTLTYTSAAGVAGSATVTVQLHDNGLTTNGGLDTSAPQTFTITVQAAATGGNHAPVANNDSYNVVQNTALTVASPGVLANDTDVDAGDTRTAVLVSAPAHGTLQLNANGAFRFTPTTGYVGTDTFRYQAKDAAGALSNIATVTFTIAPLSASSVMPVPAGPRSGGSVSIEAVINDSRIAAADAAENSPHDDARASELR